MPGTELTQLLKGYFGIHPCGLCVQRAELMDLWGPDECARRTDTIVGWLREEATKRNLPFLDAAGRLLVRRAIRNARRAGKVRAGNTPPPPPG